MPSDRSILEREMADVEVRPFTIDEFHRRRHRTQRNRRIGTTVMGLVLLATAVGGLLAAASDPDDKTITADDVPAPVVPSPSPFVGTWGSTDTDGSLQTMEIQRAGTGEHEVVIHDDAATACVGAPATLIGTGQLETPGTLVIAAQLTCDDGSTPVPMQDPDSARELEDTLANLRFVHDPTTDELVDSLGVLWRRPGAAAGDRADERGTPVDPPEGVRQMVDAINSKDTDAFLDAFAPDGAFSPRGQFAETSSLFDNHQPVAEVDLVDAWMTIVDAWGLEAELTSCTSLPVSAANVADQVDAIVECQVATRWRTLSMEITEAWVFEVGDAEVRWWNSMSCCRNDLDLVELNPPDRSLPLGYAGLEAWEAWLDANHPEDAARFLNPRATSEADCDGCAEALASLAPGDPERADRLAPLVGVVDDGWVVDGHQFTPIGLIPYDPAFADEISASIREYLEKR